MVLRLPETPESLKLEGRLLSLFQRTYFAGTLGTAGPNLKEVVNRKFNTATFRIQIDDIINDNVTHSFSYSDQRLKDLKDSGELKASLEARGLKPGSPRSGSTGAREFGSKKVYAFSLGDIKKSSSGKHIIRYGYRQGKRQEVIKEVRQRTRQAAADKLILTDETVKICQSLAAEVTDSIIEMLKENKVYELHPNQLADYIKQYWGNEKYRAVRFARTFTADLQVSSALERYKQYGIESVQFWAKLDERTTMQCRTLHGTIFPTKSRDASRYRPPLHMHCRSDLLPVPRGYTFPEDLQIQNRDFSVHYDENLNPISLKIDQEKILKTFNLIDDFNSKYRIDQFILDQDLEARLNKLNITLQTDLIDLDLSKSEPGKPGPKKKEKKVKQDVQKVLSDFDNEIRNRTEAQGEKCYLVDKKGNVILTKTGEARKIEFTDEETKLFKGNYFTHSHPSGQSFSPPDIRSSFSCKLREIRAAGKYRTYILKMKNGRTLKTSLLKKIEKDITSTEAAVRAELGPQVIKGSLSIERANALHWDMIWTRIFKNYPEIDYSFVEVSELPA